MGEVIYNLNGKYFKDFGIGISSIDGLGELKPKAKQNYNWKEYHGTAIDPTEKTMFEARELTLTGFVKGSSWDVMESNFNAVFGEFRKPGKQRLTIDIFKNKTRVYDVMSTDDILLKKAFKDGEMIGTFTAKLTEHAPVKKILYAYGKSLNIAFNSPKWVEVNIDGVVEYYKGTVNLTKALAQRVLTGYNFQGRNQLIGNDYLSTLTIVGKNLPSNFNNSTKFFTVAGANINGSEVVQDKWFVPKEVGDYTFSMFIICDKIPTSVNVSFLTQQEGHREIAAKIDYVSENKYKITATVNLTNLNAIRIVNLRNIQLSGNPQTIGFQYPKIEKGNKATDWTPAPEDQHFISIAGNIEEITGLTTNADVLWERL